MNPRDTLTTGTTSTPSAGKHDDGSPGAPVGRRPLRAVARRLAVAVLGGLVVLVGLLLVPLPGPGWAVVVLGLSFLGREFPWAARLSTWARGRVREAVRRVRRRGRPADAATGAGPRREQAVAVVR